MELFNSMLLNTTLLISVSIITGMLFNKFEKSNLWSNILYGILLGSVGIILVLNTVKLSPGLIFDTRSILVSVSALFFGALPTAIVVVIVGVCRILIGGPGTLPGILVLISSAVLGVLWNKYRLNIILQEKKNSWIELYLFGILIHLIMLLCMFSLPIHMALYTLKMIALPVIVIFPFGTLLLCMIIINNIKKVQAETVLNESELKFRTVFEEAPIGILITKDKQLLIVNKAFEAILCRTRAEIEQQGWENVTHQDDLEEDMRHKNDLDRGTIDKYSMKKRYIKPNGSIVWVNMIIAACSTASKNTTYHICMVQDITEAKQAEEKLQCSEQEYKELYEEYKTKQNLLRSLLNSIPDLFFYKDTHGAYLGCNKAFESFVGVSEHELLGSTDFDLFDNDSASFFHSMDTAIMMQKNTRIYEEELSYPDGRFCILETMKTPYYDPDGTTLGLIGMSRDITERKHKEREIQYLSSHDTLTGLYNRTYFDAALERLDQSGELPYSLIMGDIDGLKIVNDIWGHAEGDRLLIQAAKLLKKCCRSNDIPARIGGDEFSILLPDCDEVMVKSTFDQIVATFENDPLISCHDIYKASISMGFVTKSHASEDTDTLLKTADDYMYRRKLLEKKSLRSSILSTIKTTLFEKSSETETHAERMADLSKQLGIELGLSEYDLISLELAATLHDIGKIGINKEVLEKSGRLSEAEWKEMRKHPEIGYRIADKIPELTAIADYILCHHERWDGTGYPQGLRGGDIPLISRIVSVVDSYDAMTENRAYRKAISKEAAIAEITRNSGTQFDPRIAITFVEHVLGAKKVPTEDPETVSP